VNVLLFEDPATGQLEPVTTGRPAWSILCAGRRLIEIVREICDMGRCPALHPRDYLAEVVAADYPDSSPLQPSVPWTLCVNGRLVPCEATERGLRKLFAASEAAHVVDGDSLLAAVVPTNALESKEKLSGLLSSKPPNWPDTRSRPAEVEFPVFRELHDLVRFNQECFAGNMDRCLATGGWHEIAEGVFSNDPKYRLPPLVAIDSGKGPILLSAGCRILPFVYLRGPLILGNDNLIAEHASIKEFVSTGPTCKIGGELEATVIEGFTNKQHHGFLGHSHLGSWINLGAGTSNSDLKNTYGTVNLQRGNVKVPTGMQFVGCFAGDYVRTAINTSIYTGKTLGTGSTVYGAALTNVAPFTNHAASFGQVSEIDPDVLATTQQRMFARRKVMQRPCDIRLIHAMFERTSSLRQGLSRQPLSW
jgi:UDP-N-acetylglucosamine diphosphorylase / glucose-1-phosphate thymidylyltransferase / UDP-N-acetylgalactosamine diphosphorylase / glucosamine-1-phosphate N-acetyltransferase / galactosamine-1-phosphate N-acetyltransferase